MMIVALNNGKREKIIKIMNYESFNSVLFDLIIIWDESNNLLNNCEIQIHMRESESDQGEHKPISDQQAPPFLLSMIPMSSWWKLTRLSTRFKPMAK